MAEPSASIGLVSSVTGTVTIRSATGEEVAASPGMAIALNDTIVSGDDSSLEIDFADGTTFAMAANSEMQVARYVDDPDGSENGFLINFAQGAFEFVAGHIAHMLGDGMQVATPAGTLGVRGTAGAAVQDPATGEWTFMLLKDPDGHLGKIVLMNAAGEVLLDEWMEASTLRDRAETPDTPRVLSTSDVRAIFGDATGMIPELRDQSPSQDPATDEEASESPAEPPAEESEIQTQSQAATGQLSLASIVVALAAEGEGLAGKGLTPISAEIGFGKPGANIDVDQLAGALQGLFDDIFESPLVPMPVNTPRHDTAVAPQPFYYVNGSSGNDTLHGGPGEHIVNGGPGVDTIDYSSPASPHGVDVDLANGLVSDDGFGGHDTLVSIENVIGTLHADTVDVRGAGANTVNGHGGNDTLYGDASDTLLGGAGDDHLHAAAPTGGSLNGDAGTDRWNLIDSDNALIDLSLVNVTAIEIIDLSPSQNSGLTLSAADVINISDDDTLVIFGDADNTVSSTGQGWTNVGPTIVDGHAMNVYTSGTATLLVDTDIIATIS